MYSLGGIILMGFVSSLTCEINQKTKWDLKSTG